MEPLEDGVGIFLLEAKSRQRGERACAVESEEPGGGERGQAEHDEPAWALDQSAIDGSEPGGIEREGHEVERPQREDARSPREVRARERQLARAGDEDLRE